jgi:hypothetical protein
MLSTILSMFGGQIVDKLFGTLGGIIERFQQKQLSEVEAKKLILMALVSAAKEIEIVYAQELSKTYASMMTAVQSTPLVSYIWATVTISQLIVILWAQMGIPFMTYAYHEWWGDATFHYPSAGATIDWAYALLAGLVGLGAIALKNTGGTSVITDKIKTIAVK